MGYPLCSRSSLDFVALRPCLLNFVDLSRKYPFAVNPSEVLLLSTLMQIVIGVQLQSCFFLFSFGQNHLYPTFFYSNARRTVLEAHTLAADTRQRSRTERKAQLIKTTSDCSQKTSQPLTPTLETFLILYKPINPTKEEYSLRYTNRLLRSPTSRSSTIAIPTLPLL